MDRRASVRACVHMHMRAWLGVIQNASQRAPAPHIPPARTAKCYAPQVYRAPTA